MKKIIVMITAAVLCFLFSVGTAAQSYTYNSNGKAVKSPDAFVAETEITGEKLGVGAFKNPTDIKISKSGKVALSDTENLRVILTDLSFNGYTVIDNFDKNGQTDSLKSPAGLCFDNDENLYICDKDAGRILQFDKELKYIREISNPDEKLLPEGFIFAPCSVAVDKWNTVYCISDSSTNGYLQFDKSGIFKGFMGSPTTSLTFSQKVWRNIFTKEQRNKTVSQIPVNYNSITVDEEGFVYTTEVNPNKESTAISIQGGEKSGLFMPVKKFNFNGSDVLKRKDFFAPAGDIDFDKNYQDGEKDSYQLWASSIVSITLGEDGCYYIADSKRGKIFAYDSNGYLLYAFAGTGAQKGLFSGLNAIAYSSGKLYALDKNQGCICIFRMTEYGNKLHLATKLTVQRKFNEAYDKWNEILNENNNSEIALIGIGRICLEKGDYKSAMDYFESAQDLEDYNEAFVRNRKQILGKRFILIPIIIILVLTVVVFAFSKINKFNSSSSEKRYGMFGNLLYSFHIILHPFDGFWDLKHEKRGSVKAATVLIVVASICVALQNRLSGFSFNGGVTPNPFFIVLIILAAAFVFCLSNWCLTSLTDGKGKFLDIYNVVGYATTPLILMSVPIVIASNILTSGEVGIVSLLIYVSYIWTGLLLFVGVMTTHQYELGRNIISVVITLVGMVIIVFLAFLLFNLGSRIMSFADGIINELGMRW